MAYASRSGRARTDSSNPQAHAICDRCGFRYNHVNLHWQYDWRGAALQNIRILVCDRCLDTPQEQLRAIVVPADPVPIVQPRTQDFAGAETDYSTISAPTVYDSVTGIPVPSTTTLLTQDGQNMTTQPLGVPNDVDQNAIMPLNGTVKYGAALPLLSVSSIGTTTVTVTCSSPHGLVTNAQISAAGLTNKEADGLFSVTVTTATAFTYMSNVVIPAGNLLTGTSCIVTADVGLPYGYVQVPQTGV